MTKTPLAKLVRRISNAHPLAGAVLAKGVLGYSVARSAVYFTQSLPLFLQKNLIRRLSGFKNTDPAEVRAISLRKILDLLDEDAANIAKGEYPPEVLVPEKSFFGFSKTWLQILWDGIGLSLRESRKKHDWFDPEAKKRLKDLPEYYQRNFHFQTNGYLSDDSAKIYDHQVEILFLGATGAMRRQLIPILRRHIGNDPDGCTAVEIGAGTGSATRDLLLTFPDLKLTCVDPSQPYLDYASDRLKEFPNVRFVCGLGEKLENASNSVDFVYCVYVFHEVPLEIRKKIIGEAYRILKPGGVFLLVDSIQKGDDSSYDWVLDLFPQNFHEPFYKNYIDNKSESLFETMAATVPFELIETKVGFTTKVICVKK